MLESNLFPARPGPPTPVAPRLAGVYLSRPARALLSPEMTPAEFLAALADAGLFPDAFSLISALLPARLRMWWACLCIRSIGPTTLEASARRNFDAVVRWVRDPSEANRLAAGEAAAASGMGTLGFRLGLAVAIGATEPKRAAELVAESMVAFSPRPPIRRDCPVCRQFLAYGIEVDRGAVPIPPPEEERRA